MSHFNKKVIPAIVLIIAIMIIGFAIQYSQTKDVIAEEQAGAQQAEYSEQINACQVQKEQGAELSKECQTLLGQ